VKDELDESQKKYGEVEREFAKTAEEVTFKTTNLQTNKVKIRTVCVYYPLLLLINNNNNNNNNSNNNSNNNNNNNNNNKYI